MVVLDLVLGRVKEWKRSVETQQCVRLLCFYSLKFKMVNSGRIECALYLLFRHCIPKTHRPFFLYHSQCPSV